MRISQKVRVHVARESGEPERVLRTANGSVRSRLLSRLIGNRYSVMIITPEGDHVEAVEVRESSGGGCSGGSGCSSQDGCSQCGASQECFCRE